MRSVLLQNCNFNKDKSGGDAGVVDMMVAQCLWPEAATVTRYIQVGLLQEICTSKSKDNIKQIQQVMVLVAPGRAPGVLVILEGRKHLEVLSIYPWSSLVRPTIKAQAF